jgi:hypothetical protein
MDPAAQVRVKRADRIRMVSMAADIETKAPIPEAKTEAKKGKA